jgi:glutaredoxin
VNAIETTMTQATAMKKFLPPLPRLAAAASAALLLCAPAWAVYKVVGPDGKVTFTDRPPTETQGKVVPLNASGAEAGGTAALPYELRTIASRFPVTLYTVPNCGPCDEGRALLRQRGVPYQERVAGGTDADVQAWLQRLGSKDAPGLTIGGQVVRGFAASTWNSYLDAAGYPRQSKLPPGYSAPAPQPLVAQAPTPAPAPASDAAAPAAPAPAPAPGGFKF